MQNGRLIILKDFAEIPTQVFSCEYCDFFKKTFFEKIAANNCFSNSSFISKVLISDLFYFRTIVKVCRAGAKLMWMMKNFWTRMRKMRMMKMERRLVIMLTIAMITFDSLDKSLTEIHGTRLCLCNPNNFKLYGHRS